jgi:hypothetical protein
MLHRPAANEAANSRFATASFLCHKPTTRDLRPLTDFHVFWHVKEATSYLNVALLPAVCDRIRDIFSAPVMLHLERTEAKEMVPQFISRQ